MIVLDTGGLLAALDANEPLHQGCAGALTRARGPLLLSPFVLAELDYLVGKRVGRVAQAAVLDEVARGAYRLEPFGPDDVAAAIELMALYPGLDLGIADASVALLANRHRIRDILTTDLRHFRVLLAWDRAPFRLLPTDAHA